MVLWEFKASLINRVSSRVPKATQRSPVFKKDIFHSSFFLVLVTCTNPRTDKWKKRRNEWQTFTICSKEDLNLMTSK